MFAFNDILQKIEQEITRLQFTYPPKVYTTRLNTHWRWEENGFVRRWC